MFSGVRSVWLDAWRCLEILGRSLEILGDPWRSLELLEALSGVLGRALMGVDGLGG